MSVDLAVDRSLRLDVPLLVIGSKRYFVRISLDSLACDILFHVLFPAKYEVGLDPNSAFLGSTANGTSLVGSPIVDILLFAPGHPDV